jgi:formiminoglutamase
LSNRNLLVGVAKERQTGLGKERSYDRGVSRSNLPHDEKWPRASSLFTSDPTASEVVLLGIPAHLSSLSQTSAHLTPAAVREDLARYSTYSSQHDIDLSMLTMADVGDVSEPDGVQGEERVASTVRAITRDGNLLIAIGGDNSITYSVAVGIFPDLSNIGLITLDAHHDLRDGISNGSPIRRLIQAGLPGKNVVQIGISDFANSAQYSARARDYGITVIHRSVLRARSMEEVMRQALEIAGNDGRQIYVDLDVDVCDRSVVPACPASVPGGISADELRQAAFFAGADRRVRAIDITEIDASKDSQDRRTTRLAALLILETATGFAKRVC